LREAKVKHIKTERSQQRGYSPAVITEGGRIVWLAGQTGTTDDQGKSLAGDFEGQARQIFKAFDTTLQKAGGTLADMVQMTVFVTDVRYGERLWQIRKEIFGDDFPGSAMVTITALANPDAKIEIQGYAVIGSK
jgi:2-iminobutanoate/2-iminopropanoate deaminase